MADAKPDGIVEALEQSKKSFFRRDGQTTEQAKVPAGPFIRTDTPTPLRDTADAAKEKPSST